MKFLAWAAPSGFLAGVAGVGVVVWITAYHPSYKPYWVIVLPICGLCIVSRLVCAIMAARDALRSANRINDECFDEEKGLGI